jgi:peptide/nickel transport system permease protein
MTMGLSWILLLMITALFAPVIAPYSEDAIECHVERKLEGPSLAHFFGTDELGRDVFSRVILGTRISLTVGFIAVGLALLIGIPLGVVAGFFGGWIDEAIMRTTDIFLSFPPLLLAMAISAVLGPSLPNAMLAIAIAWWPWYARILRGEARALRNRPFVEAARAVGMSQGKIVVKHILPNCLVPVIIQASIDFGSILLVTASLSFLGLGAQPPIPEWGLMISSSRSYFLSAWWIVTFPGLAILSTVLALNLVGDGLREVLDPKLRHIKK